MPHVAAKKESKLRRNGVDEALGFVPDVGDHGRKLALGFNSRQLSRPDGLAQGGDQFVLRFQYSRCEDSFFGHQ
jgi:hypothetical protein